MPADEKSVGKMTGCQVPIRLVRQRPSLFCDKLISMHLYYLALFLLRWLDVVSYKLKQDGLLDNN